MAERKPSDKINRMGVVEKSFNNSSGMNPRYDYASREISKTIRGRAESVKNAVKSFESLKDISRPFRLSRECLRDLSKPVTRNEELQRSTESIQQNRDYFDSIKSAPGSIESSTDGTTGSDVFSFTFDLPSPFASLNNSPVGGSPGKLSQYIIQLERYQERYQGLMEPYFIFITLIFQHIRL